jgi:hypothetical protein
VGANRFDKLYLKEVMEEERLKTVLWLDSVETLTFQFLLPWRVKRKITHF